MMSALALTPPQEPELCFENGDLLIYLREPGQTSRGPAFRVHKAHLKERGFDFLIDRCIDRPPIYTGTKCLESACHGCDVHLPPSELYIPAPTNVDMDDIFDHHITTRNFFAWLYDLPLAGRALGRSLVTLKERIDYYRPHDAAKSSLEVMAYADKQGYLDFRECVDHALASLLLAECLHVEDLWVDAFAHCVGMSHRGLESSIEYWAISYESRVLINEAQFEMERRTEAVRRSVCDFFEYDLSIESLGLSQAAREHFDYFRFWLHGYYVVQHGFWPPVGFENPVIEHEIYAHMYSDFMNLYQHLVDPDASSGMTDLHTSISGGICTAQNIQAFDSRHRYESLPKTLPLLPYVPGDEVKRSGIQRRKSWNPLVRRRVDKDRRKTIRIQALITASNRDWAIMECPLVRLYSEFESQTIINASETISLSDGRKVRWILVYAILQTLISVLRIPTQVRNVDELTYPICCQVPRLMPWQMYSRPHRVLTLQKRPSAIEPDAQYLHSNSRPNETYTKPTLWVRQLKAKRRASLPARAMSTSISLRPSTADSTVSLKGLVKRRISLSIPPVQGSSGFSEIMIQGYGNGLNETDSHDTVAQNISHANKNLPFSTAVEVGTTSATVAKIDTTISITEPNSAATDKVPELTPTTSTSVSRESSNASANSTWSKTISDDIESEIQGTGSKLPLSVSLSDPSKPTIVDNAITNLTSRPTSAYLNHVLDEDGLMTTAHINTSTWDDLLSVLD